mgnify:CR=1 FL=1
MAYQRILRLFELADDHYQTHPERSKEYMKLAGKIAMRYRVKIPRKLKMRVCKKCNTYLVPSVTMRARIRDGYVLYTCLECGREKRYPYKQTLNPTPQQICNKKAINRYMQPQK